MAIVERPLAAAVHERWNHLYADYYQAAFRAAEQRAGSPANAEDAVQEAFVDAYEILARGDQVDNWEALIVTIAKRAAGKESRRGARDVELEATIEDDQSQARSAAERKQAFAGAFRSIRPAEQEAVYCAVVEGLTAAEIGERLGTSAESAEHLLSRGRAGMALEIVARNEALHEAVCDRPVSVVCRYLAARMSAAEAAEFKRHMETCRRCQLTVERVRDFRGFVVLLLPPGLITVPHDQLSAGVGDRLTPARSWSSPKADARLIGGALVMVLLIGGGVAITHRPAPPAPTVATSACPAGQIGGFAYLDNGNVMYRTSPHATPQQIDASGHADALMWTPDGTTLIYKDARGSDSVAGSLHAIHLGSAPFWSFGTAIDSFAISPDGSQIAALEQHNDAGGNWDGWTLYMGAIGGALTPHLESAPVTPSGPNWRDSPAGEPLAEANFVPGGFYWGIFWFGQTIYIAEGGQFATYDASGNATSSSWSPLSPSLQNLVSAVGQPPDSAVHFSRRGDVVTTTCAGSTKPMVAGSAFLQQSSSTLMLVNDPLNSRVALAVEASNGATGGDLYLITADARAAQLTTDHQAYLPIWEP